VSLSICKVLVPWLQHHPNNCVHFHHITPGVELEDHQLAHILATSTCVKAGGAPVISPDFARRRAVTRMLEGWNLLFQSKKYIGSNFLTLYQRKDTPFVPTHVKSGLWMRKAGHSHSLTARLVCCTMVMPLSGPTVLDSSLKSPRPVGAVSLWKLCHTCFTDARLMSGSWSPKNSCVICGCSNS
jgi:hypothetical protein